MELGIITADIVGSGKLAPPMREQLYAELKACMQSLKKEKWVAKFEMFRGDSLQCVAVHKEQSLRVALMVRAFMKSYTGEKELDKSKANATKGYFQGSQDIRLSIGIGKVDFYNQKSLAQSDGEAFRLSGEGLDSLKNATYRMAFKASDRTFTEWMEPTVMLLDAVIQKWTNNQAEAVLYRLKELKEEEISKMLGVSQSAVNQRLKTGQWFAIEKLLHYFEQKLKS
ncbi:MAG TPA: sigma factor-like helix-turn-helix DNA-binding protein [Flavisolibacter sp.]|nr:sigma factor-like helix-turn-helix DNA-binding protein [Flavisolibacter sp.]